MASTTKFAFTTAPLRMSLSPGKVSMQLTQIMIQTKPSVFKPNEKKKVSTYGYGWCGGVCTFSRLCGTSEGEPTRMWASAM